MKFENNSRAYEDSSFSGSGFRIEKESVAKVIDILTSFYSKPTTPIRELVINGIEATYDKYGDNTNFPPVTLSINYDDSDTDYNTLGDVNDGNSPVKITITDHGVGMSPEEVKQYITSVGSSSKDHSDEYIGGFGIAALSVLSLSSVSQWVTTKDGVTTTIAISKTDKVAKDSIVTEHTGNPSGTSVSFIVDDVDKGREIKDTIHRDFLNFFNPLELSCIIDGKEVEVGKYGYHNMSSGEALINDNGYVYSCDEEYLEENYLLDDVIIISQGNVAYPYQVDGLDLLFSSAIGDEKFNYYAGNAVIRLDLDASDITPSRESLKTSTKLNNRVVEALKSQYLKEVAECNNAISSATTPQEWLKAVSYIYSNEFKMISIEHEQLTTLFSDVRLYKVEDDNSLSSISFLDIYRDGQSTPFLDKLQGTTIIIEDDGLAIRGNLLSAVTGYSRSPQLREALSDFGEKGLYRLNNDGVLMVAYLPHGNHDALRQSPETEEIAHSKLFMRYSLRDFISEALGVNVVTKEVVAEDIRHKLSLIGLGVEELRATVGIVVADKQGEVTTFSDVSSFSSYIEEGGARLLLCCGRMPLRLNKEMAAAARDLWSKGVCIMSLGNTDAVVGNEILNHHPVVSTIPSYYIGHSFNKSIIISAYAHVISDNKSIINEIGVLMPAMYVYGILDDDLKEGLFNEESETLRIVKKIAQELTVDIMDSDNDVEAYEAIEKVLSHRAVVNKNALFEDMVTRSPESELAFDILRKLRGGNDVPERIKKLLTVALSHSRSVYEEVDQVISG